MRKESEPLTDEELTFLDKLDDVLPTSRAYVRRAIAEIRDRRAAARAFSETFEHAWSRYEARGYRYGGDALENVRFGFEIGREGSARALTDDERAALRWLVTEVRDAPDWVRPSARRKRDAALAVIDALTGGGA